MAETQNAIHSEVTRRNFIAAVATATLAGAGFACLGTKPEIAYAETSAEVRAQANQVLAKLQKLQEDLDIKSNDYFQAKAEEEEAEAKMADAQRRIDEAQAKIDKLKARLATRVRGMYKSGHTDFLDILFGSTSFSAFVNNVQLLNEMNQTDAETVEQTKVLKAQIEEEKAEYERQEAIAEAKRIEAENIMKEAQAIVDEVQAIWKSLNDKANYLLAQEIAAERARRAAEEAARRAAEEAAMAAAGGGGGGGSNWTNTGNAIVDRAGKWIGNAQYVWAACAPGKFDCSGLVAYAVTGQYRRIGTTWNFVNDHSRFRPICSAGAWNGNARAGDICVCHNSSIQHCGIYTGGNYMIHAASVSLGVIQGWFDRNIYQCVRYGG